MAHQKRPTQWNNPINSAVRPVVELLERRQLLSVSLNDGVLSIVGTEAADTVLIRPSANAPGSLRVSVNKNHRLIERAAVKRIEVRTLGGDDWVGIESSGGRITIPAVLVGGAGNDTLSGAFGNDLIRGGAGDDLITGGGGRDSLIGSAGNDRLLGGDGNDVILGGAGDDQISRGRLPGDADDVVRGGAGGDIIDYQASPTFPVATYTSSPAGWSPQQLRRAYNFGELTDKSFTNRGKGQAVAVIVAYHSPNAAADLKKFSQEYGLPTPNKNNFKQIRVSKRRAPVDEGWTTEAMLDIQWIHAIAPQATILLVEADSSMGPDVAKAIDKSVTLLNKYYQGGVVSMSLSLSGITEFPGQTAFEGSFNSRYTKKITFVAASGDFAVPSYPATSPYVLAVGGTVLTLDAFGNRVGGGATSEVAWNGSGGGPSSFFDEPLWQQNRAVNYIPDPVLGMTRGTPDLSINATNFPIYNSYGEGGQSGWFTVAGTSGSSPMISGMLALVNQMREQNRKPKLGNTVLDRIYRLGGRGASAVFNDIDTAGSANFGAGPGWDYATGWGSPNAHTLIPALSEISVPFIDKPVEFGGRATTYNPRVQATVGGNPITWVDFKGRGVLQGSATMNFFMTVNRVYGTPVGTTATMNVFGYDDAGAAVAGNPIILNRNGDTLTGQGQFVITYTSNNTTTTTTGLLMVQGKVGKGNKITGEVFTVTADGQRIKNVFTPDPLNPTLDRITLSAKWSA